MLSEPSIHLVCGGIGAGKTTYSLALQKEIGALHLSIDEWMTTLFSHDAPAVLDLGWMMPRVSRCEAQIWAIAERLGRQGIPSILDLGLQRAEHRAKFTALAVAAGIGVRLHYIDVDTAERWRRVNRRNDDKGETYRLTVTRQMFDFMERLWEPPTPAEVKSCNGVRISRGPVS